MLRVLVDTLGGFGAQAHAECLVELASVLSHYGLLASSCPRIHHFYPTHPAAARTCGNYVIYLQRASCPLLNKHLHQVADSLMLDHLS